jgi:hypothetical protein
MMAGSAEPDVVGDAVARDVAQRDLLLDCVGRLAGRIAAARGPGATDRAPGYR